MDLKSDRPSVEDALQRLSRELEMARRQGVSLLKLIHGYGSTGVGGDIRIAVQKRVHELAAAGQIRCCIFGEHWTKSDDATWSLLEANPELKSDAHLGRNNRGITIIML